MFLNKDKIRKRKIYDGIIVVTMVFSITLIVYLTGGVMYVYPHLMYIPIVICGFVFGTKYGILNALIAGFLLGPLMPLNTSTGEKQLLFNWLFRTMIFIALGILSGYANLIFNKQRRQINKSLFYHSFSNVPNPNYLRTVDYSNFDDEVLIVTILIHNFQKIVDTFSQLFHFELLNQIYVNLTNKIKDEKVIVTNNGGKFWMVINNKNIEEVNDLLERILLEDYIIDNIPIYYDFSFGYKIKNIKDIEITTELFNKTDNCANQALKLEKKYLFAAKDLLDDNQYQILSEFRTALKNNETFLQFQPKIALKKDEIKLEALIRWQHPEKGLLPPGKFIPQVEETKLVNDLSIWVLNEVIEKIKEFETKNFYPEISLNISAKNLFNDEFINQAIIMIKDSGITPNRIEFEITENTIMNNLNKSKCVLKKLKDVGIKISIDDFGKGFSSISYLTLLDIDYIKIDKGFIDDLIKDEIYAKIVKYTINISKELGYEVICEGVETKEQFELLKSLGCDYMQGYYFSKPLNQSDIIEWYKVKRDDENEKITNKI